MITFIIFVCAFLIQFTLNLILQRQMYNIFIQKVRITCDSMPNSNQKKNGKWGKVQNDRFFKAIMKHGRDWLKIQKVIKTRSLAQIRSHAQKLFQIMPKQQLRQLEKQIQRRHEYFCAHENKNSQYWSSKHNEITSKKQLKRSDLAQNPHKQDFGQRNNDGKVNYSNPQQQIQGSGIEQQQQYSQADQNLWGNNNVNMDNSYFFGMLQNYHAPQYCQTAYLQNTGNILFVIPQTPFYS